jgi:hypothetical protein
MQIQLIPKPTTQPNKQSVVLRPATVAVTARPMRVLDFDIENRPLSYLGSDFTTGEVTAISWAWCDQPENVTVYLLGETDLRSILLAFCRVYEHADMVTGHYITGHDLPMLNGALMEESLPALGDKLVQDTKTDLIRAKGISRSQESLGAMFRLEQPKVQMNQSKWRAANRLTPEGLALVRERVVGDVKQHMVMRLELDRLGYLSPAKIWRSGTAKVEGYVP